MTAISSTIKLKSKVPARSVALPVEHGAWGFLFEPLFVGLIIAPTLAAPSIALLVVGAFLTRQPLKFLIADWQSKKRLPRTELALKFALIFGGIAVCGLLGTILFAPVQSFIPFAAVAPVVVYLIVQDAARLSRELLPELLAAFALASSVAALALAGNFSIVFALSLWALMLARLIPSVLYVRSRLRLEKGKEFSKFAVIAAHVSALAIIGAFYYFSLSSSLTIIMAAFLTARAAFGLSGIRQPMKAKAVGIREVIYGVLYALTIVFGYYLNL